MTIQISKDWDEQAKKEIVIGYSIYCDGCGAYLGAKDLKDMTEDDYNKPHGCNPYREGECEN